MVCPTCIGRKGGKAKSEAKVRAARQNAKKQAPPSFAANIPPKYGQNAVRDPIIPRFKPPSPFNRSSSRGAGGYPDTIVRGPDDAGDG
jgi:hypothetical protein